MNERVNSAARTLEVLRPLMAQKGVACAPEEFYWAVNRTFHAEEACVYDRLHQHMWRSLPVIWRILCRDLLRHAPVPQEISVLDLGCGTGMATAMVLQTPLAGSVREVVLLDPSPEMLVRASRRKLPRPVARRCVEGSISDLPASSRFDLILASSVLHHIPDLPLLLARVTRCQDRGGVFVHVQDPNSDAFQDPLFAARCQELDEAMRSRQGEPLRWRLARLAAAVARRSGLTTRRDYIGRVNRRLLRSGVIRRPMTADEIWSVTDIHVPNLPFSAGHGISLEEIGRPLTGYHLVASRSYGFWGKLLSELPTRWQEAELRRIESGEVGGAWIAGVWQKQL